MSIERRIDHGSRSIHGELLFGTRPLLKTCPSGPQPLFEPRLLYGHIRYIPSAPITSLQGIYDVVTLHVHIMCQDTQALHLKCFLCQTNKLMCCHIKPNSVPATNNITHADITSISHLHLLSVYYQDLNRDSRYLSHALSTLICPHCSSHSVSRGIHYIYPYCSWQFTPRSTKI